MTAYRLAPRSERNETCPQDWATTQNNLGNALSDQARRTQGTEGTALLSQAVTAYRLAPRGPNETRPAPGLGDDPEQLGQCARVTKARRTQGTEGTALLSQAVTAYPLNRSRSERKRPAAALGSDPEQLWVLRSVTKRAGLQGTEGTALLPRPSPPTTCARGLYEKDLPPGLGDGPEQLGQCA